MFDRGLEFVELPFGVVEVEDVGPCVHVCSRAGERRIPKPLRLVGNRTMKFLIDDLYEAGYLPREDGTEEGVERAALAMVEAQYAIEEAIRRVVLEGLGTK